MESVFESLIRGAVSGWILDRNDRFAAMLEPRPSAPGHTVVFPIHKTDSLWDLEAQELASLMGYAQRVSRALKRAVPCDKIALVAYGLQVRHAHLHLIPARGVPGEISLEKERPAAEHSEMDRLSSLIRAHF